MNEVLENFDFGHREIRQRITALWRRNCRTHGECFIVKIKGLATVDRREPGTIDDHVTRFRNEALGVLFWPRHPIRAQTGEPRDRGSSSLIGRSFLARLIAKLSAARAAKAAHSQPNQ